MGWRGRVCAVVAIVAGAPGSSPGAAGPLRIDGVQLRPGAASVAVVVTTDRAYQPRVSNVRSASGVLQRIYVDFPAGTTVVRDVSRVVPGAGAVRRVGLGLVAPGRPRLVVDVAGAATFALRQPRDRKGFALLVAARAAADARDVTRADGAVSSDADGPTDAVEARTLPGRRPLRVVLDPGHGGEDPGATGIVAEKVVALAIARAVATRLVERLGAQVTLTRTRDESVSLADRTRRANAARADLLVSIHANASSRRSTRGIETYYLDNTDDRATLRLASIENEGDHGAGQGTSLDHILSSLVQGGKQEPSTDLAHHVQRGVVRRVRRDWADVVDLGVKRGPFYVLMGAYMPCILLEASFLSHPEEGRRLVDPEYQGAIADGIVRGIADFVDSRAKAGTL